MRGVEVMRHGLHPKACSTKAQGLAKSELRDKHLLEALLNRKWLLPTPESKIQRISITNTGGTQEAESSVSSFYTMNSEPSFGDALKVKREENQFFFVVRDDLLHPLINGNKARKLDALLPLVEDHGVTDVVTCGGCQSAHTAAVAVSCAERGLRSHLLLRGEEPEVLTGYNLVSKMFGNVSYVPRSVYAKREEMLTKYADLVAGSTGSVLQISDLLNVAFVSETSDVVLPLSSSSRKVVVINEGAGEVIGLLGVIRLVEHLSQDHLFGKHRRVKIVVDAGTGTTAIGFGLGVFYLGLPWEITAVMLADAIDGYKRQEGRLITEFNRNYGSNIFVDSLDREGSRFVRWTERRHPRKFGNVVKGEVEVCQEIAQQTGILLDPIYTLAAWEQATLLSLQEAEAGGDAQVVMLHTGGTLAMFGLAQRYKTHFHFPQPHETRLSW